MFSALPTFVLRSLKQFTRHGKKNLNIETEKYEQTLRKHFLLNFLYLGIKISLPHVVCMVHFCFAILETPNTVKKLNVYCLLRFLCFSIKIPQPHTAKSTSKTSTINRTMQNFCPEVYYTGLLTRVHVHKC